MSYAGNTERLAISLVTCRWPFKDRPLLSDLSASWQNRLTRRKTYNLKAYDY